MLKPHFPLLYQVNTRVWMTELSMKLGHKATLDDIPDSEIDKMAEWGFEWIWFLSVWQTGKVGQMVSRQNPVWRKEFHETLSDLKEEDIAGSGFAITGYRVSEELGGDSALARLRSRLKKRNLKLMLDFVPNHTGMDHEWVRENPDFYIKANEDDIATYPQNYARIPHLKGEMILAHGRDPFFPGWPDTLQLNYGNPHLHDAMITELIRIACQCDGVRCDMAMLVLPDVFQKTWGIACREFWPDAIRRVREINEKFIFMAEVYWDLEWTMLQNGFDYTYDKKLYDRLKDGHAKPVREHLFAGLDYQSKMARFLENHDEQRVVMEFPGAMHDAAAVITFLSPGLRFFHHGQLHGRKKKISPHLVRGPVEEVDENIELFYKNLLTIVHQPVFRNGNWQLLNCTHAWEGNETFDNYIAYAWTDSSGGKYLVAVNYSMKKSQCYVNLPFPDIDEGLWLFHDLISGNTFERDGSELESKGLYLDEQAWKVYIFSLNIK